jgi:hypothetical protein
MSPVISMIANRISVKFYALVFGAALALTPVQVLAADNDLDDDAVNDKMDNCVPWPGADTDQLVAWQNFRVRGVQTDTDDDGFGNRCDSDYDNDGIVGWSDFGILARLGGAVDQERHGREKTTMAWDYVFEMNGILVTPEMADHNDDGRVDVEDFNILLEGWGLPPGPSNTQ